MRILCHEDVVNAVAQLTTDGAYDDRAIAGALQQEFGLVKLAELIDEFGALEDIPGELGDEIAEIVWNFEVQT